MTIFFNSRFRTPLQTEASYRQKSVFRLKTFPFLLFLHNHRSLSVRLFPDTDFNLDTRFRGNDDGA
jgi:hypothetical protein